MQGLSDEDPFQQRDLVMNHLAKCGGSFVKHVLWQALPGQRLHIEDEEVSISKRDIQHNNFILGLVRNPFDYYVSLWAYTSVPSTCCHKRALTLSEQRAVLGQEEPFGKTRSDRKRFKKWLRTVSTEKLGVESMRFYGSYLFAWDELAHGHRRLPKKWQYLPSKDLEVQSAAREVNAALRNFSHAPRKGPVSCWVKTEALSDGLRECLIQYEAEVGLPVVDWAAFNRSLGDDMARNDAQHAPCSDFYDDATTKLVLAGDGHLLRAFGYPNKCSH